MDNFMDQNTSMIAAKKTLKMHLYEKENYKLLKKRWNQH